MLLGLLFILAGLVCWVIILVDAFRNEVWKGVLGLFCGLYLLYYAITEFEHDNKWLIVIGFLAGGFVGGALMQIGIPHPPIGGTTGP